MVCLCCASLRGVDVCSSLDQMSEILFHSLLIANSKGHRTAVKNKMPQKVNLRESHVIYRTLKCFYAVAGFLHFALAARLLVLLPLVGRRFLPGGINDFFNAVNCCVWPLELVLSLGHLLPITPVSYVFMRFVPAIVLLVLNKEAAIQRNTVYGLYIFDVAFTGLIGYIYHYKKFSNVGKVPQWLLGTYQLVNMVDFPLNAIMEFSILFMGLKYIDGYFKYLVQLVLLVFIPAKFQLYKRLFIKYFRLESSKVE